MPGEWETFYFMMGSSAAGLIGLLFVVITLSSEVDAARAAIAQRTFLTPTVFHFVIVLVISAAAVMPKLPLTVIAGAIVVPAAIGFLYSVAAISRLLRGKIEVPHWSDYIFYGVLPALVHLWLIVSAVSLWRAAGFAIDAVAVGVLALLLLGIRDAWDLATWLIAHRKG